MVCSSRDERRQSRQGQVASRKDQVMGWIPAKAGTVCEVCQDTLEENEEVFAQGKSIFCEGCEEEIRNERYDDSYEDDYDPIDGVGFADPGGHSALRAETEDNPRNLSCPTCKTENVLTPADRARGYQCDQCANRAEGWGG